MTIARRLIILVAVPLLALIGLGIFTRIQMANIERHTRFVAQTQVVSLAVVGNLSRHMTEMRVLVRTYMLTQDSAEQARTRAAFESDKASVERLLRQYSDSLVSNDQERRLLSEYRNLSNLWIDHAEKTISLAAAGSREEAMAWLNGPGAEAGLRLSKVSGEWIEHNETVATNGGEAAVESINASRRNILVAVGVVMLLSVVLGAMMFRTVVLPLQAMQVSVESIAAGDYEREIPFTQARDEMGDLARSIDVLKGAATALEAQRWVKGNVARITGDLPGLASVAEFGQALLSCLVPAVGGGVAAFYSVESGTGCLYRVAGHGLAPEARATISFAPGEGLVGQCAQDHKAASLLGLPPAYLRIVSGLGQAVPVQVVAWPVVCAGALLGVLEIASFREFTAREKALLEEVLPLVAMSLEILLRNIHTRELLEKSQEQSHRLELQTEELTTQQEELLAQQQELHEARQRADGATQMKSMFLANMSHEIRTPMNAILGLAYLALRTSLTPKQHDYLAKIHHAGTSLLSIINDILDFSKIEAGKLDIEQTDFRLDDVIGSVTTMTAQKAQEKGLEFLAEVPVSLPQVLLGDPLRLGQVLTNLVNNAVKFTERGEIRLKVELLQGTVDRCEMKFSVKDTGQGMSREQSGRLFQPFTQADMSTTRKHGGTGLGLTICRRLVELMGGQIWLESEAGGGSTFAFTVWLGIGEDRRAARILPGRLAALRVLVVDDNAAACEVIQESLEGVAQHADAVHSGAEALAAVRLHDTDEPYDVIFMDWRMPGMDGLQAARLIKSDETLGHQPAIVLVTAFGREEVREEAEQLHLEGFLVKPVTRSMLVDVLVDAFAETALETAAVAAESASENVRLAGLCILLAEDNEINQQIAVELLEGVGARVDVAHHGREAVDMLLAAPAPLPYHVVLMDLQMPEMDGYQATARIRSEARFADLPIVAMTAHATVEERERCQAAGMNGHVAKPIDPAALFATVARFHPAPTVASRAPVPSGSPPLPAGAPASPVPHGLPDIGGLDARDGLMRVAGNRKLYLRLLRQFADQSASLPAQVSEALAQDDLSLAERLAHSLKGVAGNIGARTVQAMAADLERALARRLPREALAPLVQAVTRALGDLMASLRLALGAVSPAPPLAGPAPILEAGATKKAVDEITRLLVEFDSGAVEALDAHQAALRTLFSSTDWGVFSQRVTGYAFADAEKQLRMTARAAGF